MFVISEDNSIYITRGDVAFFSVASETDDGEAFKFHAGDVIRFKVFEKKNCENVVLSKDFGIEEETEEALIYLEEKDTKIGEIISKPVDYWYEVELNPYTDPQTIIGYDDEDGAKIFRLFPEGAEAEDDEPITPEDIPVVDEELDLTSTRPVQNQAIARAILTIKDNVGRDINAVKEEIEADVRTEMERYKDEIAEEMYGDARGNRITNVAEPVEDTDGATKKYVDDALGLEDVSSMFVPYNADLFGNLGVYKQGKMISGTFAINHISISKDVGTTIATIQKGYRPITSGIAVVVANVFNGSTVCDGIAAYIEDGGLLAISSNSDISNAYLEISFTYICE